MVLVSGDSIPGDSMSKRRATTSFGGSGCMIDAVESSYMQVTKKSQAIPIVRAKGQQQSQIQCDESDAQDEDGT